MEIPLRLRSRADGSLVYAIPRPFRAAMAGIFALLAAALLADGRGPGLGGGLALSLSALGALYEESWAFEPGKDAIEHRVGLVFLARRRITALGDISCLRLAPFVRGADSRPRRGRRKKPGLCLLIETGDGSRRFVNAVGARKAEALRTVAAHIAGSCGLPLIEG
jgi:hypothetical protein